jgi:hypothetical protein
MAKPPQKLADIHSLLRYVPWGKLLKAEDGETVLGLLGIAFELRTGEEYLSATWVEHFDNDPDLGNAAHQAVRAVRSSELKGQPRAVLRVEASAKFGQRARTGLQKSGSCTNPQKIIQLTPPFGTGLRMRCYTTDWPKEIGRTGS